MQIVVYPVQVWLMPQLKVWLERINLFIFLNLASLSGIKGNAQLIRNYTVAVKYIWFILIRNYTVAVEYIWFILIRNYTVAVEYIIGLY